MRKQKKSNKGMLLVVAAILILLGNEAFTYLLNSTYQPEELAGQYFRLALTIPVVIFFYLGYTWAVWLMRVGFSLGIVASIFLAVVLLDKANDQSFAYLSILPVLGNIFGTWIVFGSEGFKSYIRRMKRNRGIYE
jgi:hypothetical protein